MVEATRSLLWTVAEALLAHDKRMRIFVQNPILAFLATWIFANPFLISKRADNRCKSIWSKANFSDQPLLDNPSIIYT